ncbi:Mrp/NBP35 family ATP-binding protein [Roseospira visakhapatnamensis]|uniref:Iron-sulfur cluster carrier protein n=1 Tax=Roseospira visakhapatnamensis TaxID=390880 RepID=A0A7W6RFU0_9PROT|nr:Mrp/NBP35 family ATP-binding protein [Roseospira visakhapatnamensis]MBB4267226.1 ATP-binding protein involved in chromosome partitioning [Roseospira visakhapatnamensis]
MAPPSKDDLSKDSVTQESVLETLRGLRDPKTGGDPVSQGWVAGLSLADGAVTVALDVPPDLGPQLEPLRREAEARLSALPGVNACTVVLTAQRPAAAPAGRGGHGPNHGQGQGHGGGGKGTGIAPPGVRHIIAVASGKGGVGKSTTAVNLALGLAGQGLRVGLFDADIFGPSIPRMLGLAGERPEVVKDRLQPLRAHGLAVMSIGFLVEEDEPVVWRGPMVMGALEQLLRDVDWGDLDVMVVDMPPGTGDTQLTMSQRVTLAGAVIVSTPQDIALLDARKGLAMFRRVNVPILGLIENMSYYVCPNCGHREEVFAHGGARRTAEEMDCPFLGDIPLDMRIRVQSDAGRPIVVAEPDGPHAAAYRAIAARVAEALEAPAAAADQGPTIRFT